MPRRSRSTERRGSYHQSQPPRSGIPPQRFQSAGPAPSYSSNAKPNRTGQLAAGAGGFAAGALLGSALSSHGGGGGGGSSASGGGTGSEYQNQGTGPGGPIFNGNPCEFELFNFVNCARRNENYNVACTDLEKMLVNCRIQNGWESK